MSALPSGGGPTRRPCPTCGKPGSETYRPFCSKRCADVDLARWLGEQYRVPGPPAPNAGEDPDKDGEGRG
ncbi:MAG: DNA gyrase inhibitor YacG [Pseudomonadota bacterium]